MPTLTEAGALSINGQNVGTHDYAIHEGNVTIDSAWDPADWFTTTEDAKSAWVVVKGDLTIDAGEVFAPP